MMVSLGIKNPRKSGTSSSVRWKTESGAMDEYLWASRITACVYGMLKFKTELCLGLETKVQRKMSANDNADKL
jgi:hypothetical protein